MTATVTLDLSEYEGMKERLKDYFERIEQFEKDIELVHKMSYTQLTKAARDIRDNRARNELREAIMTGKF